MRKVAYLLALAMMAVACKRESSQAAKAPEAEKNAVTHWTKNTELFVEYPRLVAGEKSRFAVHFTNLHDFKPVAKGRVIIALQQNNGPGRAFTTEAPSRPGIFGVDVQPDRPGTYTMTIRLGAPALQDTHDLGTVVVLASGDKAAVHENQRQEETTAFLKEQQWALDFATEPVTTRALRESIRIPAEVRPRSGGVSYVSAPIAGRVAQSSQIPVVGTPVSRGQPLLSIVPFTQTPGERPELELAVAQSSTDLDLARRNHERVKRLLDAGAIPARRVEEAKAAEQNAAARLQAARERLILYENSLRAQGSEGKSMFVARAPISGVVSELKTSPGENVTQGANLLRVVAVDIVYIYGNLPESEIYRARRLSGAEVEVPGADLRLPVGRLVTIGREIDPQTRTLGITYEMPNQNRLLAVGQSAFLRLFMSERNSAPAVPESAIVDDAGRPVVFVQLEGEAFARRPVKLGAHEGGYVQVLEGVHPGERVVTRGGYLIRLASMSSQIPAHGHVH